MLFEHAVFIGIDPTAGGRPLTFAALDRHLRPLRLAAGSETEALAFVRGQEKAIAAVCGPPRPNQGLMQNQEIRDALNPPPRPGRWHRYRLVEYLLNQHGIRIPRTPTQTENCPRWMHTSFDLYHHLEESGFLAGPQPNAARQWIEVYPHASYTVLLGHLPYAKNSLEGRLQRQLLLHQLGVEIPDPMRVFEEITRHRILQGVLSLEALYSTAELDALIAAYTAWTVAQRPEQVTVLGDPREGQIVLPVAELKPRYR